MSAGEEKEERAGLVSGLGWTEVSVGFGLWVPFLFLFLFLFFSFPNLIQTKLEFKYGFEFKPHSNI